MKLLTLTPTEFTRLPRWQKRPVRVLLLGKFVITWSTKPPVTPTENGENSHE